MALSPADGDDDGDVAEGHHEDRQQPGQREEVEEVGQLQLLVGEGDRVQTLSEERLLCIFSYSCVFCLVTQKPPGTCRTAPRGESGG